MPYQIKCLTVARAITVFVLAALFVLGVTASAIGKGWGGFEQGWPPIDEKSWHQAQVVEGAKITAHVVCTEERIRAIAVEAQVGRQLPTLALGYADGSCFAVPLAPVVTPVKIEPKKYVDYAGDDFYIIQLDEGIYTLGWPSANLSLGHQPAGFNI